MEKFVSKGNCTTPAVEKSCPCCTSARPSDGNRLYARGFFISVVIVSQRNRAPVRLASPENERKRRRA